MVQNKVQNMEEHWNESENRNKIELAQLVPNAPYLYLLKTSESDVLKG